MEVRNKDRYTWKNFLESRYYDDLCHFFYSLKKKWEDNNDVVFVFVSRRAFCVFLLMKKMGVLNEWDHIQVYADRYIMKNLNFDFLQGKDIILVDDSIISGFHIKKSYELVEHKTAANSINIYIFAAESKWKSKSCNSEHEALRKLSFAVVYSYNDILKLSSIETLLFNTCGIPYMVELPVLTETRSVKSKPGIIFSRQEFERFRLLQTENWTYHEYEQVGYLQNDTTCGCLVLENHILKQRFAGFIQNLTVRVQITLAGDKVKVIFIPFAILKSVDFEALYHFVEIIYEGTSYINALRKYRGSCEERGLNFEEESYVSLYRAVVYSISYYIGMELIEFMKMYFGKTLTFFKEYNQYIFDNSFQNSTRKVFKDSMGIFFVIKLLQQEPFQRVFHRKEVEPVLKNVSMREYTYERVYNYILGIKNELLQELSNEELESNMQSEIYITIEEFEEVFESNFFVNDFKKMNDCISGCVSSMLSQGVLVNQLHYDKNKNIVYRGFSYGENSDAFYSISAKVFYAAVLKYYEIAGDDFENKYGFFTMNLYRFFKDQLLFGTFISEDEFNHYVKYFRQVGKRKEQIENKRFLLDEHATPYYIRLVEEYVSNLDFS